MATKKIGTEAEKKKATAKNSNEYTVGYSGTGKPPSEVALTKMPTYAINKDKDYSSAVNYKNDLLSGGVRYSEATTNAMNWLTNAKESLKSNSHSAQRDELANKIMNREDFSYDMSKDTLWQNALASAMESGKTAMADTMGQAAALTGGYGSSYATAAAAGTYNQYISDIYDNLPQYYQMALNQYEMEGNELYNRYNLVDSQYQQEYNEKQNDYSNAMNEYFNLSNRDIDLYNMDVNNAFKNIGIASDVYNNTYDANAKAIADQNANTVAGWQQSISDYWTGENVTLNKAELTERIRANKASEANASASLAQRQKEHADALAQQKIENDLQERAMALKENSANAKSGDGVEKSKYTATQQDKIKKDLYKATRDKLKTDKNINVVGFVKNYLNSNNSGVLNDPYMDELLEDIFKDFHLDNNFMLKW